MDFFQKAVEPLGVPLPWGPGNPLDGQPKGCPSVPRMVYSCSMPNQGCWSFTISITLLHASRRFVSVCSTQFLRLSTDPFHTPHTTQIVYINNVNVKATVMSPVGLWLYFITSHSTSLLGSLRNGSRNIAAGMRYMSLLEPSDW